VASKPVAAPSAVGAPKPVVEAKRVESKPIETKPTTVMTAANKPVVAPNAVGDPKAAALHNQRGRELINAGKYREAVDELTEAIRRQPDLALAYNARGFAYYLLRDNTHALADYDEAIRLNPHYENAIHNREVARSAGAGASAAAK
jgi:Flp pilus assembly protein TadD